MCVNHRGNPVQGSARRLDNAQGTQQSMAGSAPAGKTAARPETWKAAGHACIKGQQAQHGWQDKPCWTSHNKHQESRRPCLHEGPQVQQRLVILR